VIKRVGKIIKKKIEKKVKLISYIPVHVITNRERRKKLKTYIAVRRVLLMLCSSA